MRGTEELARGVSKRASDKLPGKKDKARWKELTRQARRTAEKGGASPEAAAAAGVEAKVSVLPPTLFFVLGATCVPMLGELYELQYQREAPFLVDDSEFLARFPESEPTPMDEAVAATAAWYKARAEEKQAALSASASGNFSLCVLS